MKRLLLLSLVLLAALTVNAQSKRAWEIGVGGSVYQFNRVTFNEFVTSDQGHNIYMKLRHVVYGGDLYIARELSNVFTLDLQNTVGTAEDALLYQVGLGLQWRLGHYFKSPFIDPYIRISGNYMYKGFDILYTDSKNGMTWTMFNDKNKEGADATHLFPITAGRGINMWLNSRFGIGMQGDYLCIPKTDVANPLKGTVRLMWRFGGNPKGVQSVPEPARIEYREVIKRDTIYQERRVEVEKRVVETDNLYEMISNISFDFDKSDLKPEHRATIRRIAELLNRDTSRRFLITGYADVRGTSSYNRTLSFNRAQAIMDALIQAGVPANMIKIKGVGNRVAHAPYQAPNNVREGDRKITIELITNNDYWQIL
jgi:outer membrane protein OmpA-like peptidoglycan-associated protein